MIEMDLLYFRVDKKQCLYYVKLYPKKFYKKVKMYKNVNSKINNHC
jgi:hypothetical protein